MIEKWSTDLPKGYGVFWWRKEKGPTHYLLRVVEFADTKQLHALDLLGHMPRIRGPRFVNDLGGEWLHIALPGRENEPDDPKASVPS